MTFTGLRRDVLCAMTGFLAVTSASGASAVQVHVLQPGETIAAVARKYHVGVADIVRANKLSNPNSVPDFTKLHIPSPAEHVVASATMHRTAKAKGDSVSVRLGPNESRPRMVYLYSGTTVTVTAIRDGWDQIKLNSGKQGWVRADFLAFGKSDKTVSSQHISVAAKSLPKKPVQVAHHKSSVHPKHVAVASKPVHHHDAPTHAKRLAHHSPVHTIHVAKHWNAKKHVAHNGHHKLNVAPAGGSDIVRTAFAYRGTPYRYGGSGGGGFDCSGFTRYLYSRRGISLPHSARGQFEHGRSVGRGELTPGDLVFFHTVTPGISHVGMYVGNGKFVHASSRRSGGVRVDSLNSGYYRGAFRGARHIR